MRLLDFNVLDGDALSNLLDGRWKMGASILHDNVEGLEMELHDVTGLKINYSRYHKPGHRPGGDDCGEKNRKPILLPTHM